MASAPSKKFKNSNLNAVLGAPKATPANFGPAVRTAAVIKPKAKPKGLVALGKAPGSTTSNVKKGTVWNQLAAKSKETTKVDDVAASPEWAVMNFQDLERPRNVENPNDDGSNDDGSPVDRDLLGEEDGAPSDIEADEASERSQRPKQFERQASVGSQSLPEEMPAEGGEARHEARDAVASSPEDNRRDASEEFAGSSMEHAEDRQADDAERYVAATAAGDRPPYMAPPPSTPAPAPPVAAEAPKTTKSPTLRSSTKSWVDAFDEEEEEMQLGSAHEDFHSDTQSPINAWQAPRRSPPQTPPPAAPIVGQQAEAMAPIARYAQSGYAAPPCPSAPPPPAPSPSSKRPGGPTAQAPGSLESRGLGGQRPPHEDHRAGPTFAPGQDSAESQYRDEPFPAHGDPKLHEQNSNDIHGSRQEQPRAEQPRWGDARGAGLHSQAAAPDHSRGLGAVGRPGPAKAPMPVGAPPAADWAPPRAMNGGAGGATQQDATRSCWGPAVAYTPAFAPRGPVNRPMSEDFVNSGWKDKKLWEPPKANKDDKNHPPGGRQKPRPQAESAAAHSPSDVVPSGNAKAAAGGKENADNVTQSVGGQKKKVMAESLQERPQQSAADVHVETEKIPRKPKAAKVPKGPLEALDPDSSSEEESDDEDILPPEYAVLDLTVPRTALVINVAHVLKRLSGCCSLNQLNKAMKSFKEKIGVSLETFLRANPMNFKLEGRIVYLVDRDGEKWKPPEGAEQDDSQPAKGKGKGKEKKSKGGDANQAPRSSENHAAESKGKGKGKDKKSKGGDANQAQRSGEDHAAESTGNKGGGGKRGGDRGGNRGGERGGNRGNDRSGNRGDDRDGGDRNGNKGGSSEQSWGTSEYDKSWEYQKNGGSNYDYNWSSHAWDSEWSSGGWNTGGWSGKWS